MNSAFSTHELDNGLRLVFETIPRIHSAALGFFVRTGSRDESDDIVGVSHFLEHMMFKGTPNRTWRQLTLDVDQIGAIWNAYTWWEGTAFFHWVQREKIPESIEITADMMRSTIPPDEFTMEKKVILEEIALYRDHPERLIIDELLGLAYQGHPLGQSVLGTPESIGPLPHERMVDYFRRRYSPANMTFLITGNFDRDEVIAEVKRYCGHWEPFETGREQPHPVFTPGMQTEARKEVAREHLAIAIPAPAYGDEWAPTAEVVGRLLGDSRNSRLFWSVRQAGLADSVAASYAGFSDTGLLFIHASTPPERAQEALDRIREELRRLHDGVNAEEVARARAKEATGLVASGENSLSRFSQLVENLSCDRPLRLLEEELAELDAVTPKRIADYLSAYPTDGEPALVAIGPLDSLN